MGQYDKQESGLSGVAPLKPAFDKTITPARQARAVFEPGNALGSIARGRQQFTILGDTDHRDPSIIKAVSDNIPAMAKSGVRHLMIEYPPHPETEALIQGLYAKPQKITDDQIRKNSGLFESSMPGTPEGRRESGKQFAELLINAHKNGVQLHFAGDHRGADIMGQIQDMKDRQEKFVQEQPAMHAMFQKYLEGGDEYLRSAGVREEMLNDVGSNLMDHGRRYLSFGEKISTLYELHEKARMGPQAEGERADRFIKMAGGEKAAIMFGADHVRNSNDLNEALDQRLRAEAFKKGTLADFETTKMVGLYSSREAYKNSALNPVASDANYFQKEGRGELTDQGRQGFTPAIQGQAPAVSVERRLTQ